MDSFGVKILRNNRIYKGKAHIERGQLTVSLHNGGMKSASVSSNNHRLAGMLLRELAADYERIGVL